MTLIHNERTKLLANALDRASTACVTVGVLAPVAATIYTQGGTFPATRNLIIGAIAWILAAVLLHIAARNVLKRLQ